MAGSIRVAGHTIAEHDIANDKVDIKNATLASSVVVPSDLNINDTLTNSNKLPSKYSSSFTDVDGNARNLYVSNPYYDPYISYQTGDNKQFWITEVPLSSLEQNSQYQGYLKTEIALNWNNGDGFFHGFAFAYIRYTETTIYTRVSGAAANTTITHGLATRNGVSSCVYLNIYLSAGINGSLFLQSQSIVPVSIEVK